MFNEEYVVAKTLGDLVSVLSRHTDSYQIIIVDDGSTDNSICEVTPFLRDNIVLVRNEYNCGIGGSFINGMSRVTLPLVTWFPSDGEFPAIELVKMISLADLQKAVVCVPSNSKQMRSPFRYLLSKSFVLLVSALFGMRLRYYNGMAIYSSDHIREIKLKSLGFTFPLEVLYKLSQKGVRFEQIEVELQKRVAGKSKAISFKVLIDVLIQIYKIRFT